jgi:predicted DNA binding protein
VGYGDVLSLKPRPEGRGFRWLSVRERRWGKLTDRQYQAVETATRLGYYDVPRTVSLLAVANDLGVAEATASELLRRAESNLMGRLFDIGSDREP